MARLDQAANARDAMRFTLTTRFANEPGQREEHDYASLVAELDSLANVLDSLAPGETITIERIR